MISRGVDRWSTLAYVSMGRVGKRMRLRFSILLITNKKQFIFTYVGSVFLTEVIILFAVGSYISFVHVTLKSGVFSIIRACYFKIRSIFNFKVMNENE
jgi:hypothetical protein